MVRSIIGEVVSYYPFSSYQVKTDGTNWNTRKYYSFGASTVAMRENELTVTWLLSDQINSTTITAAADGSFLAEIRYTSFGEGRYANGQLVTDKLYTGQQQETEIGLDYYVARFYDPVLAHFIQPDSIIPSAGSTQGFDRYAYVMNNPVRYSDPTGNRVSTGCGPNGDSPCTPTDLELAINAQKLAYLEYDPSGQKQEKNAKIAQGVLDGIEIAATTLFEPLDWMSMANDCITGECSPWYALALLPVIPGTVSKHLDEVADLSKINKSSSEIITFYPPNQGFLSEPTEVILKQGDIISRRGSSKGRFFSPPGLSPSVLALPPGTSELPEKLFEVQKSFSVYAGPATPWFGQVGGGLQYFSPIMNQAYLEKLLYISPIN